MDERVFAIIDFGKQLLGAPYLGWDGNFTDNKIEPFYVKEKKSVEYVKKHGVCCSGFINLLVHHVGLKINHSGPYSGGTDGWYCYLKKKNCLQKFSETNWYPIGTLFLRNYYNYKDQGHMAILYNYTIGSIEKKDIMEANIIHAYYDDNVSHVGITTLNYSHSIKNKSYYEYAILPEDWLS